MQRAKRLFALSRIPESAHGVPVPADDGSPKMYEQIIKQGYDFAKPATSKVDNAGYSTGYSTATKEEIDKHRYPFSLNERATSALAGRRMSAAFGLPVSAPVVGSTGAHSHEFEPLGVATEAELPTYTYVEKEGEPEDPDDVTDDRRLPGAGMESLNFSSGGDESYLNLASAWQPMGRSIDPGHPDFFEVNFKLDGDKHVLMDDDANEVSLRSSQAVVNIFPEKNLGGTAIQEVCGFRSLQFGYNTGTNFEAGYNCPTFDDPDDPESGQVRGSAPAGNPSISVRFRLVKTTLLAQDAGLNPISKLRKNQKFSVSFKYIAGLIAGITGTSINHSLDLQFLQLSISDIDDADENGAAAWDITATVLALGDDFGFKAILINNVASYATLA